MHCYEVLFLAAVFLSLLVTGIMTIDGLATCYDSTLDDGTCHNPPFLSYGSPFLFDLGASIVALATWLIARRLISEHLGRRRERQRATRAEQNIELGIVREPRRPVQVTRTPRMRFPTPHRARPHVRDSFECQGRGDSVEDVVNMYEAHSTTSSRDCKSPSFPSPAGGGK